MIANVLVKAQIDSSDLSSFGKDLSERLRKNFESLIETKIGIQSLLERHPEDLSETATTKLTAILKDINKAENILAVLVAKTTGI